MRILNALAVVGVLALGCSESATEKAIREARTRVDAGVVVAPVPARATLLASGQNVPRNLLVDGTHLYWLNEGLRAEGKPGVFRVSKSGGEPQTLYEGKGVYAIALGGESVFAIVPPEEVVLRIPKAGGEAEVVRRDTRGLLALTSDATHAYWTCEDGVLRVPVEGGKPQTVVKELFNPTGLAVDGSSYYWYSSIDGDLKRAPRGTGKPRSWIKQELTLHGYIAHGGDVFWSLGSEGKAEIRRASGSTGKVQQVTAGASIPVELTADEGHVYWTTGKAVMRAPRSGGSAEAVVEGTDRSMGVAVDEGYVYWTDRFGRIQRVAR